MVPSMLLSTQSINRLLKAHYLLRVVALVARKSLWPRTTVATKTKKTLLSRVVVAFVAFLCPLFLYQNAAVLYLNVDVAIFANFGNQKIIVIFGG